MSWKDDVKIDVNDLFNEWLDLPELYSKYLELEINAERNYSKLCEELSYLVAKYDKGVRLDPDKFGCPKLAETPIQRTIDRQASVVLKKEEVIEAKYQLDLYKKTIMRSLSTKKDSLTAITKAQEDGKWASKVSHKNSGAVVEDVKERAKTRKANKSKEFDDVTFED
jgi:hypothetical protein